jgi:hypothetical protein
MALHSRGVRTLFVSTLVLTAALTACDQPTTVESGLAPAFAPLPPGVVPVSCADTEISGNKEVRVAVKLSGGAVAAPGVVVTLVGEQEGPQCYATTNDPDGIVVFTNVAQGAEIFVVARDQMKESVAKLETIPPDISGDLQVLFNAPDVTRARQTPTMLTGSSCTVALPWSWKSWAQAFGVSPCVVPGPGLDLTLTMDSEAEITTLTLVDPDGTKLENVVVSALSPWYDGIQADACAKMPWVVAAPWDCADTSDSSGPALIQSVDVTNSDGKVELSHVEQTETTPIVLEAITVDASGQVFFATIMDAIGGTDFATVQMAPGMCSIVRVEDLIDSSIPAVDIMFSEHSVGMKWDDAIPTEINNVLIVRAEVHATLAGGAGTFDLTWQPEGKTKALSVRAAFTIPAGHEEQCSTPMTWSGNGLSALVARRGYCAGSENDTGEPLGEGRMPYALYFVVTLPETVVLKDAWYKLSTVQDGIDPSKALNFRAGISFNGELPPNTSDDTLNRDSCPVRENNDGRFDTYRLGNNDGRFDTY